MATSRRGRRRCVRPASGLLGVDLRGQHVDEARGFPRCFGVLLTGVQSTVTPPPVPCTWDPWRGGAERRRASRPFRRSRADRVGWHSRSVPAQGLRRIAGHFGLEHFEDVVTNDGRCPGAWRVPGVAAHSRSGTRRPPSAIRRCSDFPTRAGCAAVQQKQRSCSAAVPVKSSAKSMLGSGGSFECIRLPAP